MKRTIGATTISLVRGDITEQHVDAIVNAANAQLAGGSGVDGAIHRAGGPAIMAECRAIGGCPTGQGRAHHCWGPSSEVRHSHAVGPIWRGGGHGEPDLLASAYTASLEAAAAAGARTIAFPSISTGAYGYPKASAADIALATVASCAPELNFDEIRFVLFSDADLQVYQQALAQLAPHESDGS